MELFNILDCTIGGTNIPSSITNIFHFLISVIKFGVPVLLVIWGSWDLGKAVMAQKEDEIKNAQKLFIKKLIIAVCVFLVPTFISLAIGIVDSGANYDTESCWSAIFSGGAGEGE